MSYTPPPKASLEDSYVDLSDDRRAHFVVSLSKRTLNQGQRNTLKQQIAAMPGVISAKFTDPEPNFGVQSRLVVTTQTTAPGTEKSTAVTAQAIINSLEIDEKIAMAISAINGVEQVRGGFEIICGENMDETACAHTAQQIKSIEGVLGAEFSRLIRPQEEKPHLIILFNAAHGRKAVEDSVRNTVPGIQHIRNTDTSSYRPFATSALWKSA